jgi:hypothetical protein
VEVSRRENPLVPRFLGDASANTSGLSVALSSSLQDAERELERVECGARDLGQAAQNKDPGCDRTGVRA